MTRDRRSEILDATEIAIRRRGLGGFSIRDVAAEVGIKSASVHYHFPTKKHLGVATVRTYKAAFFANLAQSESFRFTAQGRVAHLCELYLHTYERGRAPCLIAAMAANSTFMPEDIQKEISNFLNELHDWIDASLGQSKMLTADIVIAGLQGASLRASAQVNPGPILQVWSYFSQLLAHERRRAEGL